MEQQISNQISSNTNQKSLHIIYGVVIVILIGVIAYFAIGKNSKPMNNETVQQTNSTNTLLPTAQQKESFSVYQNDLDLYAVTYPSKWIIHAHTSNFLGDPLGRITFSEMPISIGDTAPLLSVFSERSHKVHTEKDWLNSFGLGAEIREVSTEKIGNETFKHFIATYGIDGSQVDYFIRERKIYAGTNDPTTSFFGYSIS